MTPWTAAWQTSLFITKSQNLLKPMTMKLVMPSSHLICSVIPFSSCLQSFPASGSFPQKRSSIELLVLYQIVVARVAIPVLSMILGNIFCFSLLEMILAVSLSYICFPLLCWGTFLPYLICLEFLSRTNIKFCEIFFYISCRWLYNFCPHSVNMMYHIYWFARDEPSLHFRDKSHLIEVYNNFNVLWNSVC